MFQLQSFFHARAIHHVNGCCNREHNSVTTASSIGVSPFFAVIPHNASSKISLQSFFHARAIHHVNGCCNREHNSVTTASSIGVSPFFAVIPHNASSKISL